MTIFDMKGIIRRFGRYCGVRHLRNRGIPFRVAYYAVFGREPRFA